MADVDVKELLGAYLAGDIRPEERAAVERLLSDDLETRAVLESLRDVLGSVQHADCPVTPAMTRQLRERLAPLLADEVTSAALGSALAGELTAPEQEQLKRYLREHPDEKTRMSAMRNTAQWMKKNQPVASDAMSAALRERLAAKIPALRGLETQVSRETTMVKTPPILLPTAKPARAATTSSLRVVAKDDPWKRRFAMGAAAAAASVALAFGIARVFETKPQIANNGTTPEVAPKPSDPLPEAPHTPEVEPRLVVIPPQTKTNENEIPRPLPLPQDAPVVRNDEPKPLVNPPAPQDRIVRETPKKPIVIPQERDVDPFTPKTPAPEVTTNKTTPKTIDESVPINSVVRAPVNEVATGNENRSPNGVPIPLGPGGQSVPPPRPPMNSTDGTAVASGTGEGVRNSSLPKVTETIPTTPTKAATNEAGISVLSVKNGSVSAQAEGGEQQTLTSAQVGSQLASGTELITSQTSRIVLDLPDGRLWVNQSSRLRVRTSGSTTTVELGGGQFAFETSKGSLVVNTAGQAVVTAAKNVDVRLENGALITVVLGERATIKGKKVERGQQATVMNPASSDQPTVKPADGIATNWRAEDEQLAPANDNPAKGKSKSKSRSR